MMISHPRLHWEEAVVTLSFGVEVGNPSRLTILSSFWGLALTTYPNRNIPFKASRRHTFPVFNVCRPSHFTFKLLTGHLHFFSSIVSSPFTHFIISPFDRQLPSPGRGSVISLLYLHVQKLLVLKSVYD